MRALSIFCIAILLLGTAVAPLSGAPAPRVVNVPASPKAEPLPGGDIEALAFAVLMQTARAAQDDLRAVMESVKKANETKKKLREQLHGTRRPPSTVSDPCKSETVAAWRNCLAKLRAAAARMEVAALDLSKAAVLDARALSERMLRSMQAVKEGRLRPAASGSLAQPCGHPAVVAWKSCLEVVRARVASDAPDGEALRLLDAAIAAVRSDLDRMSEMGEMESLRLQMAMDRMSKMMSALSNILKKISDTANQITQNLK